MARVPKRQSIPGVPPGFTPEMNSFLLAVKQQLDRLERITNIADATLQAATESSSAELAAAIASLTTAIATAVSDAEDYTDTEIAALSGTYLTEASAAEYRSKATGKLGISTETAFDAAAFVALTDAATIAVDMNAGFNFSVTIAGNRTLGNPTNEKVGQCGCVRVTASGATRTLNKGSDWDSTTAISWPISIASGQIAYIFYFVNAANNIIVTGLLENPT